MDLTKFWVDTLIGSKLNITPLLYIWVSPEAPYKWRESHFKLTKTDCVSTDIDGAKREAVDGWMARFSGYNGILSNAADTQSQTLVFCRNGEKISDFDVEWKLTDFFNHRILHWEVSNVLVVQALRARIAQGEVDCNDVGVLVEDLSHNDLTPFDIKPDARAEGWVDSMLLLVGYLDTLTKQL